MDWARILACVTGTVDRELLARNEYLATENRILKDQLKGRLMLSHVRDLDRFCGWARALRCACGVCSQNEEPQDHRAGFTVLFVLVTAAAACLSAAGLLCSGRVCVDFS
jgi:hypothetical protein